MPGAKRPASPAGHGTDVGAQLSLDTDRAPSTPGPSSSQSNRLHFAFFAALGVAALITLAAPIADVPARGQPTPSSNIPYVPPPAPVTVTVHSDGVSFAHSTLDTTVGQALASAAIRVGANDIVAPALDSPIFPGLDIYVTRAKPVRIIFEGRERLVYTHAPTVRDLLLEHGIQPQHTDRIFPALDDPVRKGMTVSFVSFRDGIEVIEERLPYSTVYQDDPDLLAGEERLVAAGVEGFIRREYRITRLNGAEAARELVGEITFPATDEVIAVGTGSPTTPPPLPILTMDGFICSRIISVYATYYTADSAGGGGVTATGTGVYRGIVAVDPAFIPLGTRMWVPGYGHGLAADTGGSITGNIIDLGYGPNDPIDWIPHYLDICILL